MDIALAQSAVDCGCGAGNFLKDENTLVESFDAPGARRYLKLPHVCNFVYYGAGIVASAGREYMEAAGRCLEMFPAGRAEYAMFETPGMHLVNGIFEGVGARVCFMAEYFLPDMRALRERTCPVEVRILERGELGELYTPEWGNALCRERAELDVLGVGAYDRGKLVGLAGCSADCDTMWQIGVDVLPGYRRRGIASALTSRLALETMRRGKVPFYCAAWSNLRSVRNSISAGFRPAWVELGVGKREFVDGMNAGRQMS